MGLKPTNRYFSYDESNQKEAEDQIQMKLCPFCGSKAKLINDRNAYKVFCTDIWCDAQYGWCYDKGDAINGWNRRANDG